MSAPLPDSVIPDVRAVGKLELLSRQRHLDDLLLCDLPDGHPRGLYFDAGAGLRVVKFIESYCKHHKGEWAGKPLTLEVWQKDILVQAFGWMREDGTRRYRTIYIEVARKNGKSELAAALGLYLLVSDNEAGAEVYSSATKKDQAKIVWTTAVAMVKKSPDLRRFIEPFQNSLTVARTDSSFQPLGADSNTLDGLNPHGNIVDELHAHRDRGVWDVLDSAMGSRRQPMTIAITTAGVYDKEGIGWEMHDYAQKVLEGTFQDDSFFAFIACPDENDDSFSVSTQQKANPNWGISVKPEYMGKQAEKAQKMPGFLNEYLVKHINTWTQQVKRWMPMDKWAECEPPAPLVGHRAKAEARAAQFNRMACHGGLDLSSKLDLTALVLEFALPNDAVFLLPRFWLPEARVEEEAKKGKHHFETWVKDGWIQTTPGDVIDYEFIRKEVNALKLVYNIQSIAYDPWAAMDLATRLTGDGLVMVECRQGYKTLSEPSKDAMAKVASLKVEHMHHPVMRWCASNAVVTMDAAGNIKPDKEKAKDRIDGIVAWVMARSRSIVGDVKVENPYEGRGFLSV